MQNILVATDFSKGSDHALQHALGFQKLFQVPVHVVHCLDSGKIGPDQGSGAATQLAELSNRFPTITSTEVVEGPFLDRLQQCVEERQVDLLVIGSFGQSGQQPYFIGSNAQQLIRAIRCPILTVTAAPQPPLFQQVVYASDFDLNERPSFQYFLEWLKPQRPELHLLTIHRNTFFSPPRIVEIESLKDYEALAQPLQCQRHLIDRRNVEGGIRSFATTIGADMIVMANTNDLPLGRLFTSSYVEAVILSAELPVLTINLPR